MFTFKFFAYLLGWLKYSLSPRMSPAAKNLVALIMYTLISFGLGQSVDSHMRAGYQMDYIR